MHVNFLAILKFFDLKLKFNFSEFRYISYFLKKYFIYKYIIIIEKKLFPLPNPALGARLQKIPLTFYAIG